MNEYYTYSDTLRTHSIICRCIQIKHCNNISNVTHRENESINCHKGSQLKPGSRKSTSQTVRTRAGTRTETLSEAGGSTGTDRGTEREGEGESNSLASFQAISK